MKKVTFLSTLTRVKGIPEPSILTFYKVTLKLKKKKRVLCKKKKI